MTVRCHAVSLCIPCDLLPVATHQRGAMRRLHLRRGHPARAQRSRLQAAHQEEKRKLQRDRDGLQRRLRDTERRAVALLRDQSRHEQALARKDRQIQDSQHALHTLKARDRRCFHPFTSSDSPTFRRQQRVRGSGMPHLSGVVCVRSASTVIRDRAVQAAVGASPRRQEMSQQTLQWWDRQIALLAQRACAGGRVAELEQQSAALQQRLQALHDSSAEPDDCSSSALHVPSHAAWHTHAQLKRTLFPCNMVETREAPCLPCKALRGHSALHRCDCVAQKSHAQ